MVRGWFAGSDWLAVLRRLAGLCNRDVCMCISRSRISSHHTSRSRHHRYQPPPSLIPPAPNHRQPNPPSPSTSPISIASTYILPPHIDTTHTPRHECIGSWVVPCARTRAKAKARAGARAGADPWISSHLSRSLPCFTPSRRQTSHDPRVSLDPTSTVQTPEAR